jgi:hypothetical protein
MLILPGTWVAEIGGLQFEAGINKKLVRSFLKEQAWCGGTQL